MRVCGIIILMMALMGCGGNPKASETLSMLAEGESVSPGDVAPGDGGLSGLPAFDADSAYAYLACQVEFGPRVPNTPAHKAAGDWLASELRRHGAEVTEQKARLRAFDGTMLDARNIFARISPKDSASAKRAPLLLLAHWDCRPWADQDPDPAKRKEAVDGANDGASGVAVLLEIARQLSINPVGRPIDILFVDAEDWGEDGDESSWALGTQYFVSNPPVKGYAPEGAILLDMVGGEGAVFCREYFSERANPRLAQQFWETAHKLGYSEMFLNQIGSAVTDDHVELIKAGIPAIDIIEYHPGEGFNPRWHTTQDNLSGISKVTLSAVGNTLLTLLRQ